MEQDNTKMIVYTITTDEYAILDSDGILLDLDAFLPTTYKNKLLESISTSLIGFLNTGYLIAGGATLLVSFYCISYGCSRSIRPCKPAPTVSFVPFVDEEAPSQTENANTQKSIELSANAKKSIELSKVSPPKQLRVSNPLVKSRKPANLNQTLDQTSSNSPPQAKNLKLKNSN